MRTRLTSLRTRFKMAGVMRKTIDWFKIAWAREPVLFMSCVFGISGSLTVCYFVYKMFVSRYVLLNRLKSRSTY